MPSLMEILEDPNYVNANEATKQAIFDKYSALDNDFSGANDATKDAIRQRFGVPVAEAEPETSGIAALGHGVLRSIVPSAAGLIGGAAGATVGTAAGPVGTIAGGLGAGFASSAAAAAAQEEFLKAHPETAKFLGIDAETAAKEAKEHPYASFTGELLPNLAAFRPSGALLRSGKGLAEDAAKQLAAEKTAAVGNAILNTGVGAGMEAGQQAMGEEPMDYGRVGIAALGGALGQKETALGRGLVRAGEFVGTPAQRAAVAAFRRPEPEVTPNIIPEIPPEKAVSPEYVPPSQSQDTAMMIKSMEPGYEHPEFINEAKPIIQPEVTPAEEAKAEPVVAEPIKTEPLIQKELPPETPKIVPAEEPITKLTQKQEPVPEPVKVEPVPVNRLEDPEVQASLKRYADEAGWSEIGGKIIREVADDYSSPVIGRTRWTPNANWWFDRPVNLKGDINGRATQKAVNKALNGEKLTPNEKKMVDFLVNMHDSDMAEGDRIRAEMEARDREVEEFNKQFQTQETPEQAQARMAQEEAARKAREDEELQAEMDAQAERDRKEIERRSQERAQDFELGQTPEESLTGQRRIDLDEDIPFERQAASHTPKFAGDAESLGKTLRSSLDQMGLKDIGLQLSDSLNARVAGKMESVNGAYFDNMIALSLNGDNIHRTMNHEALHAMKDHGFFSPKDWDTLSRKAQSDWMKKYDISKDYGHLPMEGQIEEAIAKAFADYRTEPPKVRSIMAKAIDALKRVGNVLRGRGFKNAEDIFGQAAEGKLKATKAPEITRAKFEQVEKKKETARNVLGQNVSSNWEVTPNSWIEENIVRKFQDKHIDLKRTVEAIKKNFGEIADKFNPYLKDGLWRSKSANEFRLFDENDLEPLAKKIDSLKLTTKEVTDYLHNKHAPKRNEQMNKVNPDIVDENGITHEYALKDRGSGISTKDAEAYLKALPEAKRKALEDVAQDVYKIVKGTQDLLVKSGQIKQDVVDAWRRTYGDEYVPLQRDMEEEFMNNSTVGRSMAARNVFEKRAMGSERDVLDILNSVIRQREIAIENAAKMEVDHALYGLAIKYPNPDLWLPVSPKAIKNPELLARELDAMGLDGKDIVGMMQERQTRTIVKDPNTGLDKVVYKTNPLERYKNNVLPIRINGEDSYIFFNKKNPVSANMVKSFRGMDTPTVGLAGQQIGKVTQWMAKVNTQWNPVFGALNFMRDFGSAMANLSNTELRGEQKAVAGGIKEAMGTILKTMRDERKGGGYPDTEMGKLYKEFRENGGQTLYREQLSRRADQENIINEKINKLHSSAAKKRASAFFNGLSDFNDSIENAIRLSAYKVAKEKGLSIDRAATLAKELTVNFDRKGAYGTAINNYFAFFNASAQGTARMVQTLKGPAGKKIIMGGIGLGALQAGMMAMAGFDENDPPEFVKSRNFIIPNPLSEGGYVAIPYPLGLHFLPNIGRLAVETGLHGNFIKHAGDMAAVVADAFNPMGGGDLSLQTISPTVLDPVVALATNKDAFGRPISKEDRATAPTPGFARSREQATEVNKAVAEAINYITGGTEDTKGFLSPTADQLDYLVGQVTGGAGREAMKIGKTATAIAEGKTEELPSYQIPLAGRFYGDINSPAANSQHFYDNVTKMAEYESTIKGMRERKENVADFIRENPDARLWQQANNAENQISQINKQIKDAEKRGLPEERIKALNDRKQVIMTNFNERVKALK